MKDNTEDKPGYKSEDEPHLHTDSRECQCCQCRNGDIQVFLIPDIDDIVESLNDWD